MKLRVQENERLVRDSGTLAILNTDLTALRSHDQKIEQLRKLKAQEAEINNIKSDISDIKDLLRQLLGQK